MIIKYVVVRHNSNKNFVIDNIDVATFNNYELADYYVYFYDKDVDCVVRCEADNVGLTVYMRMCGCVMLGYTRKFMRNRFDESRDVSSGFMDKVRVLDL